MGDWLFIADAHLREWDVEQQRRMIRFFDRERKNITSLVILGDLFEFWFGFDHFAFGGYRPVLDKLQELAEKGTRIRYVEGNHDFGLGIFFKETLGAHVDVRDCEIRLGGNRIYMAHGDLVNRRDRSYVIFRSLLKNPVTYRLMQCVGPRVSKRVAAFLSSASAGKGGRTDVGKVERTFRQFAMKKIREGVDVVILAHSHLPQACTFRVEGREAHYFNVGDWIGHFSFLRYRPGQGFKIEYFQESNSG